MSTETLPPEAENPIWLVEQNSHVLIAKLNRPAVRNALNIACWKGLDELITQANLDDNIRALIITGSENIFSAGGDMKNVESTGSGLMKDATRLRYLHQVLGHIAEASIPIIAAVEGPAVGVAWGMALTCDYVVAAKNASFIAPFGLRSLVPDGGIAFHFVNSLGRLQATKMLFGNCTLSGSEAHDLNLVSETTEPGKALSRAIEIANELANTSRDTLMLTKRLLRRAEQSGYQSFMQAELELASLNLHNPELATSRMNFKDPKTDTSTAKRKS